MNVNFLKSHLFHAILLHGLIFLLLIFSFHFPTKNIVAEKGDSQIEVIQATIVNSPTQHKSISPIKPLPIKSLLIKSLPIKSLPEVKKVIPKASVAVSHSDKIILADPKLQRVKAREQLLADLAKQKKIQQQNKRQQQKAIATAFAKEIKQLAAKSLQKQMQQEQNRISALHARRLKGEVDHYRALILQAISQNWRVPGIPDKNLAAELFIHLAPGGTVLDVQIAKSSGNSALDHSAQMAVFRASPLPVPSERQAFEPFCQFILKVRPENIQSVS